MKSGVVIGLGVFGLTLLAQAGSGQESAQALWRRSLKAGMETPMRGTMRLTQRLTGKYYTSEAAVIQGTGGRFRLTYRSPVASKGRWLLFDGVSYWQYDPKSRQTLRTDPPVRDASEDSRNHALIERNYRFTLEPKQEKLNGRRVAVLHVLPRQAGKLSQRRWIDIATGKTLKSETYYRDGILLSRLLYTPDALPAHLTEGELAAPRSGSAVTSTQSALSDAEIADLLARRRLKREITSGFVLQRAVKSQTAGGETTQLLYTDGLETVSLFMQKTEGVSLTSDTRWEPLTLAGQPAAMQRSGHILTVVWVRDKVRYTAVARIGRTAFLELLPSLTTR